MPQREPGQVTTQRCGLRTQLGGTERAQVEVDQVQPAGARGEHVARSPLGLREDGAGEPAGRPRPYVARSARGCGPQVSHAGGPSSPSQREPAGQQVRLGGKHDIHRLQDAGEPAGRTQELHRRVAGVEAALQQHELGAGRPPGTLLVTEHPQRLGTAGRGRRGVTGGGRGQGGGEQQLPPAGRGPVKPDTAPDRLVGHPQRVPVQLGGEQHPHPGDVQVRLEDLELVDHPLCVVEEGKGGRQVAAGEGGGGAVVARRGVLEPLTRSYEQLLAAGVVRIGARNGPEGEVRHRSVVERPRLPHQVAGPGQQVDRPLRRAEHLAVAGEHPQGVGLADLDAPRRRADRPVGGLLDLGQSRARSPRHHQRDAVGRPDVRAALEVTGAARAAEGGPELHQRLVDVAEVPQHDARRLVCDGGDAGGNALGEERAGGGERLVRPRERERQQVVQILGR